MKALLNLQDEYEVLCDDQPSSLKYLASKKIRDLIRRHDQITNAKYSTKIINFLIAIEKALASIVRKVSKNYFNYFDIDYNIYNISNKLC